MKICSRCKVNKPLSAFHSDPRYRLGVTGHCTGCRNEASRLRKAQIRLLLKPSIPEKRCSTCKTVKPVTNFYRSVAALDGYYSRCKECWDAKTVSYRMDSARALKMRLRNYGMTPDDFHAMIEAQRGLCAICEKPFAKPVIDHDHATGAIRALLCFCCNNWLAAVEHPDYVARARQYLDDVMRAPVRFRINQRWLEQRKRRKAEIKAQRLA